MQGNFITTILALVFYLTSGLFGGNSHQGQPSVAPQPPVVSQPSQYPLSGEVSGQQAIVRSDTSSSSSIVRTVPKGASLLITAAKTDWYQVQTEDGSTGWVAKWLVSPKKYSSVSTNKKQVIAGYYVENNINDVSSQTTLSSRLGSINTVIPFSYKVDQYGTVSGQQSQKSLSLAKTTGLDTIALVNNIQGANFNSNTAHRLLSNKTSRTRAITGITRLLVEKGYRGVNIDFENVPARDRIYLTAFFRELSTALRPKNLLVTASIPAKTFDDKSSSHSGAFSYQDIAPYLDQVMIMTYDEHYSGGSAGPVASYPWVEKVINYTLRYFPAQKIVIGIAGYGYNWDWRSGKAMTFSAIQKLLKQYKVAPKWHSVYKVPYFSYKSWGVSHQVWYENSASTALKADLVNKYGLRGVAVWRLGYEDPGIWSVFRQKFK